MSEQNKTIELNDDELEKVSGGNPLNNNILSAGTIFEAELGSTILAVTQDTVMDSSNPDSTLVPVRFGTAFGPNRMYVDFNEYETVTYLYITIGFKYSEELTNRLKNSF